MVASAQAGPVLVEAARALGRRAIVLQGWAGLKDAGGAKDCLFVGDINHERLFGRVAAIVHHGGAGTTVAAARAGKPQVVVPHHYDQYYWSRRVRKLGIGVAGPSAKELTARTLADAVRACLKPQIAAAARSIAFRIEIHGTRHAAERLVSEFG